ncbi:hypothetical protein LEN26_002153 [Aphanomyces euteiches]|nr:hypothetical protein LEN26_002153 [Aphanomyces euteiches]KAH9183024.1 hypothetical protein AeNC1_015001 [Aphanomyces euteiches]
MILTCVVVGQEREPFLVDIAADQRVDFVKETIKEKIQYAGSASRLQLYPALMKDGAWLGSRSQLARQLKMGDIPDEVKKLLVLDNRLGPASPLNEELKLPIGPNQIHVLVVVSEAKAIESLPKEEHFEQLLSMLEWREPKRLCESAGQNWPYQGASELVVELTSPLAEHYKAWQQKNQDKQNHAITGMLCKAAVQSKNQELVNRMESAYVFRVTFGNDPAYDGSLLDSNNPEFDISYRMIYQLAKLGIVWDVFVSTLTNFTSLELRIKQVMVILAKLEEISNVEDMSVILCVDDLQKLTNNGTMNCAFYRVLASVCKFLNSSTVFAVCVCSATIQSPVELALSDPRQKCVFLVPPVLRDDMGGHGRALETLQEVLSRYEKEKLKRIDPGFIVDEFLEEPLQCQDILAAILSRRRYNLDETFGKTGMTIDRLRSFGLFQWTHEGYLECASLFL